MYCIVPYCTALFWGTFLLERGGGRDGDPLELVLRALGLLPASARAGLRRLVMQVGCDDRHRLEASPWEGQMRDGQQEFAATLRPRGEIVVAQLRHHFEPLDGPLLTENGQSSLSSLRALPGVAICRHIVRLAPRPRSASPTVVLKPVPQHGRYLLA